MNLVDTINSLAEKYNYPIIISTHPRTRKMIESKNIKFHNLIQLMKPLGFVDYNKLQIEAMCVLSDSGTVSEESSILRFKALNIREAHERPEAMEEAAVMMVGLKKDRIFQALSAIENQDIYKTITVDDYMKPNVSDKVVKIIIGYVDYVNRKVWNK